jgi:hypothetical protein
MLRNQPLGIITALSCFMVLGGSRSFAASRADVTITPLGGGAIEQGRTTQSFRIPTDINGLLPQALVIVAAQPLAAVAPAAPLADAPESEEEVPKVKVPATIKITIAGEQLPDWRLYKFASAYVISPATLRTNPQYAAGRVEINFDLDTVAEAVNISAFGMPDPLLLSDSLDGPISIYLEQAQDPQLKAYFGAMANEMAGNKELARTTYHQLAASENERLAQLARRGVRLLSYDQRPHKLSGNFREHYRWGLFLGQTGVFAAAFKEFNECRIIYQKHSDAQYRAGEMLDHMDGDIFKVQDYMDRAASSAFERHPAQWSVLIVLIRGEGDARLSDSRLLDLKASWIIAKDMVRGATSGKVVPQAVVYELDKLDAFPLSTYAGGLVGPAEDIVAKRGWFDSVIFVRPRGPDDSGPRVQTIGGDVGPNGAALSTLGTDATWQDFLLAWYQQFSWAARNGGLTDGIPMPDELTDVGHHPVPDIGYAIRAALKYHWPPEVLPWVKMVPRPGATEFVRLWDMPGSILSSGTNPVESKSDVVDVNRLGASAGVSDEPFARCWVYSPLDQQAGVWLSGSAAVDVNGRPVFNPSDPSAAPPKVLHPDTAAAIAMLRTGWNEVKVTFAPGRASTDASYRFSLRFCGIDDRPIPGLAYVNVPPDTDLVSTDAQPRPGAHYAWDRVRRDWSTSLPNLSIDDLRQITGVSSLRLSGTAGEHGHAVLGGLQPSSGAVVHNLNAEWKPGEDSDVVLNNVFDWNREDCMALRYKRDGRDRDLLFVKPEALMAYMTLLDEPAAADQLFGKAPVEERLLGYVLVPTRQSSRRLFVLDCLLGRDGVWPQDEEDLLGPIAREYIPNPPRMGPGFRQDSE